MPKKTNYLSFPFKEIRAEVIFWHVIRTPYKGVVVYSCGNASAALKKRFKAYPEKQVIAPRPKKWASMVDIARKYPRYFDGSSGHLPLWMMQEIAWSFKQYLGNLPLKRYYVATGSGETIICLRLAYPKKEFIGVYNINEGSKYEEYAPLNDTVKALFKTKNARIRP